MPVLAGAFLVGVVGVKWITNEADKGLPKESIKSRRYRKCQREKAAEVVSSTPLQVLQSVKGV
jgi:hypothetical protein